MQNSAITRETQDLIIGLCLTLCCWFLLICPVEGQGVASEVNDILAEVKLLVNISHRCGFGVHALKGLGVILIKVGNKD